MTFLYWLGWVAFMHTGRRLAIRSYEDAGGEWWYAANLRGLFLGTYRP